MVHMIRPVNHEKISKIERSNETTCGAGGARLGLRSVTVDHKVAK
jgi:hypothetical protein